MTDDKVIELIMAELRHAEKKHPCWPTDQVYKAAILGEEAGEVMKAALDYEYGKTPIDRERFYAELIKETAQVGAMAIRLLKSLQA